MSVLRNFETTIANLVEGIFGHLFRSEVRPIELAHKLAREMDEHRTTSLSRTYAPNEYSIWLSSADRARYEGVEGEVIDELCAYLLEHARREELILASQPSITFHTDSSLALGEFGIHARLVRGDERGEQPRQAEASEEHGRTMIFSGAARAREPIDQAHARRPQRALLAIGAKRLLVPPAGGVIGRSRDCDIVLDDAGVSRRHAELRPGGDGWTLSDLGSTNGVRVNGHAIRKPSVLRAGDRVELGSTEIVFELS